MKALVCVLSVLLVINPLLRRGADDWLISPLRNPHMTDAVIVPRSCSKWNTPGPQGQQMILGGLECSGTGAAVVCGARSKGRADSRRAVGKAGDES